MVDSEAIVLLVEDNDDHAELVIRNLSSHAIPSKIYHVRDGQGALDFLLRQGEFSDPQNSPRPDLILLDLRLPKIEGLQVLSTIKQSELLRQIPVVILTTSSAERDITRAYQYYANSYLVKPVGFEQFNKLIDTLGLYWLSWNSRAVL